MESATATEVGQWSPVREAVKIAAAQEVVDLVAEGKSLRAACLETGVKLPTFLRWCSQDAALADQYTRARATGTDADFEDLAEVQAMEPERDQNGKVDPGWVAWKRLQVDTRKWALSKKAPKKYGERIELGGEVNHNVSLIDSLKALR